MTIGTTQSSVTVLGNGVTTSFTYDFPIPAAADAVITYVDGSGNSTVLQPSQYVITGLASPSGGTVTYPTSGSPIPAGTSLTIQRVLPLIQTTSISNQGPTFAAIEGALDYLTMCMQDVSVEITNAIRAPATDPANLNYVVPAVDLRVNQLLGFDSNGNVIVAQPSSALVSAAMQPIVSAASLPEAQSLFTGRVFPVSPISLYVNNSSGSNANTGLSPLSPFLTIQHAVDLVCDNYLVANQPLIIQLQTTGVAYNEAVTLRRWVGSLSVSPTTYTGPTIQGDTSNNAAVTVAPTNGNCFTAVAVSSPWLIKSLKMAPPNGGGIEADFGSVVYHQNCNFGSTPNGSHLLASFTGSRIEALRSGGFNISGGAQAHANAQSGGQIITQSGIGTITISGTPTFTDAFAVQADGALIDYSSATFSGGAHGKQAQVDGTGIVLGPTNFAIGMGLPGDLAGIFSAPLADQEVRKLLGDEGYGVQFTDRFIAWTATLTSPRTANLAPAADVPPGEIVYFLDGGAINGANTITIACHSGDVFTDTSTSYVMNTQGKNTAIMSAGPGFWYKLIT